MEFIVEQQAQFAAGIQASQAAHDAAVKLQNEQNRKLSAALTALAFNKVERYISGNGKKPSGDSA
jgi:hypothetical protein